MLLEPPMSLVHQNHSPCKAIWTKIFQQENMNETDDYTNNPLINNPFKMNFKHRKTYCSPTIRTDQILLTSKINFCILL